MKLFISLFFIFIYTFSASQEYINTVIDSEHKPFVRNIYRYNDSHYLIPYIYGASDSVYTAFVFTDFSSNYEIIYKDIKMGNDPLEKIGDNYYHVGEDPYDYTHILTCKKYNASLDSVIWKYEYPIEGVRSNSSGFASLNNNLFMLNTTNVSEDPSQWLLHLTKIDTMGNLLWVKEYGNQATYNVAHSFFPSLDNNLFISQITSYYPQLNSGATRLIKINEDGDILWESESKETLVSGGTGVYATELSDSNIVQMYEVDMIMNEDWDGNKWWLHPTKLKWIDKHGDSIKTKLLKSKPKDPLYLRGMETGNGDYFYTYGNYEIDTDSLYDYDYGIIMKFDNNGDTIWVHRYKHPDYEHERASHDIDDILELDNGDIIALGDIRGRDDDDNWYTKIWVMRLDENGCFGTDICDDYVTGANNINTENRSIEKNIFYPNPTSGLLQFDEKWINKIESMYIYDCNGKIIYENNTINTNEINLSLHPPGIYFAKIRLSENRLYVSKIIKI